MNYANTTTPLPSETHTDTRTMEKRQPGSSSMQEQRFFKRYYSIENFKRNIYLKEEEEALCAHQRDVASLHIRCAHRFPSKRVHVCYILSLLCVCVLKRERERKQRYRSIIVVLTCRARWPCPVFSLHIVIHLPRLHPLPLLAFIS
jgi:hypothetical protein